MHSLTPILAAAKMCDARFIDLVATLCALGAVALVLIVRSTVGATRGRIFRG